jgi:hypothetical protein
MSYIGFTLSCMKPLIPLIALLGSLLAAGPAYPDDNVMTSTNDYDVIELRRYTIKDGHSDEFARLFDTLFPEAFQQLGALALGQFTESGRQDKFTWLRGFHDMDGRAVANAAFYYGPLWKEHRTRLNELMTDSDDVLLLRPLGPGQGVPVLPAVDPVREQGGARGVVVAQIFPVGTHGVAAFATAASALLARYRAAGARDAGLLATLDAPNNFPQLPVRSDGPFVVWLGVVDNMDSVDMRLRPLAEAAAAQFSADGLLRAKATLLVLQPTPRSRLRWLPASAFGAVR